MNYYALLPLTGVITNLVLGFYVLMRVKGGRMSFLYFLLSLCLAGWSLGNFLVFISPTAEVALGTNKIAIAAAIFVGPVFFHFVTVFLKFNILNRVWKYLVLYLPVLVLLYLGLFTGLIADHVEKVKLHQQELVASIRFTKVLLIFSPDRSLVLI